MEEIITKEKLTFKTMFAVLPSLEAYTALNNAIGAAKSYPDERSDTFFYSDPNPDPISGMFYMTITTEVQEKWPDLLTNIDLVENIPYDTEGATDN